MSSSPGDVHSRVTVVDVYDFTRRSVTAAGQVSSTPITSLLPLPEHDENNATVIDNTTTTTADGDGDFLAMAVLLEERVGRRFPTEIARMSTASRVARLMYIESQRALGGIRFHGEKIGHSTWRGLYILPFLVGRSTDIIFAVLRWIETVGRPAQS